MVSSKVMYIYSKLSVGKLIYSNLKTKLVGNLIGCRRCPAVSHIIETVISINTTYKYW